jgi:hypothetical protein
MRFGGFVLVLIAAAAVAACGGANQPICATPPIPAFYMIYPSPGATGIPDNLSEISFGGTASGSVALVNGTQVTALTLVAQSPVPQPSGQPPGSFPSYIATLSAPLSASTTYTVKETVTFSGGSCVPYTSVSSLGSFTTQ